MREKGNTSRGPTGNGLAHAGGEGGGARPRLEMAGAHVFRDFATFPKVDWKHRKKGI